MRNQERADSTEVTNRPEETLLEWEQFLHRHIGPDEEEQRQMLSFLGLRSLEDLSAKVVPVSVRSTATLKLPVPKTEFAMLQSAREIARQNRVFKSYLGMGYSDCITPPVIQRNILENPGWYTQYTPYQAEISQGRLESLLNFQTMVMDLTAMDIANASLLDEATAAAEAMTLCYNAKGSADKNEFLVSARCHPQTISVVQTRAWPLGIDVRVIDSTDFAPGPKTFAALIQYPDTLGAIVDYRPLAESLHKQDALLVAAADLLALTLLTPPGEFGADVAVGSAQRFGVPLGYGGPHAAFFATRDALKRQMPGRLIGVSKDSHGRPAFRLSLQTREQHIRREKATSNICTAQALLANIAAMYAVYHGPAGLKRIATRVRASAIALAAGLERLGFQTGGLLGAEGENHFFDTVCVPLEGSRVRQILNLAHERCINLRCYDQRAITISLDETTTLADIDELLSIFNNGQAASFSASDLLDRAAPLPPHLARTSAYLRHPVFHTHHSETEMLRYLKRLEGKDLSLTTSMIPLGSCTMKLNASSEMFPISWPELNRLHPFAPLDQAAGYQRFFADLEKWLAEITRFARCSLQPNAGSQGEYAGLLAIQQYHRSRGQGHRDICLIPQSAHGTNPASAAMAGLKVIAVACDKAGNIDLADLRAKAQAHAPQLSCLMVTYPSTHGVFEEGIRDICRIVHEAGGQVYMDGANLNAQVGLCGPGEIGADVCHINLHKTFCIPHGGGGPGMGPICVAAHLAPFLPGHPVIPIAGGQGGPVSAAPWGSASILLISWMYIGMMGAKGLTQATQIAILNANYIAARLHPYFPVLYRGQTGLIAHECILDLRHFKKVTVEDVAKRLMDYGFHAPTISFPVPGTLMIEPTESEPKDELDRFCEALIAIHGEIQQIESGQVDSANNLLKNAPHTAESLLVEKWDRPYPREQAAFPLPWVRQRKFWPPVGRIDNVYGDRNLICSCAGMDAYAETL